MAIKIEGLDNLFNTLEDLADSRAVIPSLEKACALVERTAKQKAQSFNGSGDLARSITSKVDVIGGDIVGAVFTPLHYAPYVEFGTGIHAEKGGRSGWWVYVKGSDTKGTGGKHYTEEEAKAACEYLRSKGLDAYATNGREPTPFMRPALNENREQIKTILKGAFKD